MAEVIIRDAVLEDARKLAPYLRASDVKEIKLIAGVGPLAALSFPFSKPAEMRKVYAVLLDNRVSGLFGVSLSGISSGGSKIGSPWFLSSEKLMESQWRRFLRETPAWVRKLGVGYDVLENFVHEDNSLHIRWLKYAKFDFVEHIKEFGVSRTGFWRFRKVITNKSTLRDAIRQIN